MQNQDIIEEMYDMKNLINNNLKQIRRYQDDLRLDMNELKSMGNMSTNGRENMKNRLILMENQYLSIHNEVESVHKLVENIPTDKNCSSIEQAINLSLLSVDFALLCEVWHKAENKKHGKAIEGMLELNGLKYMSTSRPKGKRGGGAAIIVNLERFAVVEIANPHNLEIVRALAKPNSHNAKI